MKLSAFKAQLETTNRVTFIKPNGEFVPKHFHITEAGLITKNFIDCGGTVRTEKTITFQLWVANDLDHRLESEKLLKIISLASPLYHGEDLEIEVELQTETISKYSVGVHGENFMLIPKQTNCLAQDACGIPIKNKLLQMNEPATEKSSCTPGGGCC